MHIYILVYVCTCIKTILCKDAYLYEYTSMHTGKYQYICMHV